jgi:hypothetical protein
VVKGQLSPLSIVLKKMSVTFAAPKKVADNLNQAVSTEPALGTMEKINNFLLRFSRVPSSGCFRQHLGYA